MSEIEPDFNDAAEESNNFADTEETNINLQEDLARTDDAGEKDALQKQIASTEIEMQSIAVKVFSALSGDSTSSEEVVKTIGDTCDSMSKVETPGQVEPINSDQVKLVRTAEASSSDEVKTAVENANKTLQPQIDKVTEALKANGVDFDSLKGDVDQLKADMDDSNVGNDELAQKINDLMEKADKIMEDSKTAKEKIKAAEGEKGWSKWKILTALILFLGTVAGLCIWSYLQAKKRTGCYIYSNGDSSKLNCSGWYKQGNNAEYCRCGTLVPIGTPTPDCSKLSGDECKYPYCLGNPCSPKADPGGYGICGQGNLPQCTNNADKTASGSVYYSYNEVPWYSPMAGLPNAIIRGATNLGNDVIDKIMQFLKKFGVIIALVFFGLFIVSHLLNYGEKELEGDAPSK